MKGLEFPPQIAPTGVPVPPPLPDSEVESPSEEFSVIQRVSSIILSGVSGAFSRKATKPKSSQTVDTAKSETTDKDSEEVEPSEIIPDVVSSVPVPIPKQSQTAFCRYCGSEISCDSSFCSSCGQRTSNNTAPSQPTFYQPPPPQQAVQVIVHNSSSSSAKSGCGEGCAYGCLGLILLFFVMMLIGSCLNISENSNESGKRISNPPTYNTSPTTSPNYGSGVTPMTPEEKRKFQELDKLREDMGMPMTEEIRLQRRRAAGLPPN